MVFYTYDKTGNVLTADYAGEQTETNTYNELGLLTTVTTAEGDTLYQYDAASRLISVTQPNGETVSYTYDSHGNRATMTYPNGKTVKYTYDDMNRLIAVKGVDGETTKYAYDVLGRRISTDGVKEDTTYAYDEVGNLVSQTTTGAYDLALEYAYDLSGRMTNESRTENGATLTSNYIYDALGQLTSFTRSDGQSETYTYDPVGNMTAKTQNGVQTAMRYNAANQLIQSVTGNDTTKYTYDANGNLVRSENAGGARSYAYNALNLLESFTREDGYTETYTYNANRLLSTIKTSEDLTTTLTWDILYGDGVVISADQNGQTTNYTYGLERISALSGSTRTEYVYDGRGSVAAEVSYNNAWYTFGGGLARKTVTSKSYTPFGEQIGETVSGFGYNGEYYNAATGMIYLRARFYEPEMNRFGQKDLVRGSAFAPQSLNRYLYVQNDPINFVDSNGRDLKSAWNTVKGAVVGAVKGAVTGATIGAAVGGVVGGIVGAVTGAVAGGVAGAIASRSHPAQAENAYPPTTPASVVKDRITSFQNRIGEAIDHVKHLPKIGTEEDRINRGKPSVGEFGASGACILINKKVDNIFGNKPLNVEHMSALFMDSKGDWYFFFWGDVVTFERIDDPQVFESMDSLNSYLFEHGLYNREDRPYFRSVYIEGDFTASIDEANYLKSVFSESDSGILTPNPDYSVSMSNCTQVTMRLVELGILPSGANVGDYLEDHKINISAVPNWNMTEMQNLFRNTALNYDQFIIQTSN